MQILTEVFFSWRRSHWRSIVTAPRNDTGERDHGRGRCHLDGMLARRGDKHRLDFSVAVRSGGWTSRRELRSMPSRRGVCQDDTPLQLTKSSSTERPMQPPSRRTSSSSQRSARPQQVATRFPNRKRVACWRVPKIKAALRHVSGISVAQEYTRIRRRTHAGGLNSYTRVRRNRWRPTKSPNVNNPSADGSGT